MSEPFAVECGSCFASFKLKDRALIGKKIRCPKCKEPMVVKDATQAAEDDWLSDDLETAAAPAPQQRGLPPKISGSEPKKAASSDKPKAKKKRAAEESGMAFDVFMWIVGGLIGGGIGSTVWALIVWNSGYEIGWVAWGIGALVGCCVHVCSRGHEGPLPGMTAATIAVLSILFGKYLAVVLILGDLGPLGEIDVPANGEIHENELIAELADEIAYKREEQGIVVSWPGENDDEFEYSETPAELPNDYPADIWQEAVGSWNAMPQAERDAKLAEFQSEREEIAEFAESFGSNMRWEVWKETFGPLDVLWILLAVSTAYRLGSGWEPGDD
jgi:hypothetical protein